MPDESAIPTQPGPLRRVWRACASLRLAVVLLILLAIACFVGIVLSQPESFQASHYVRRRLMPSAPEALKPAEFIELGRVAGIRVQGLTYDEFAARPDHEGEGEEELQQEFMAAFAQAVGGEEEPVDCLRLFYVDEYGRFFGSAMLALRLHVVFTSLWFRLLCVLLIVNLVACSTQRLGAQWRAAFGLRPPKEPDWYGRRSVRRSLTLAGSVDEAADAAERALRAQGFRVTRRRSTGAATLEAHRGWLGALGRLWWPLGRLTGLGRLGAQVVHLGIILIMVGGFISGQLGFRHAQLMGPDDTVAVPEVPARLRLGERLGQAREELLRLFRGGLKPPEVEIDSLAKRDWRVGDGWAPKKVAFRLRLRSFEVRLDVQGKPAYYGSKVALLDREPPSEQVIEVNRPLVYRGYYAYQQSYQPNYRRASSVSFLVYEMSQRQDAGGHIHGAAPEGEVRRRISVVAEPERDMAVPSTSLTLRVLRYFPHFQIGLVPGPDGRQVAGPARNVSDQPLNPAVEVRLQAPGLPPRDRWVFLPFRPGEPRGSANYGTYLVGAVEFTPDYDTVLMFKTHPVMLPVWIGCAVVMLGIILAFYCNHQRVWALVQPWEGEAPAEPSAPTPREGEAPAEPSAAAPREGEAPAEPSAAAPRGGEAPAEPRSELHLAGDSFKWRERLKDRFEAVVSQLEKGR